MMTNMDSSSTVDENAQQSASGVVGTAATTTTVVLLSDQHRQLLSSCFPKNVVEAFMATTTATTKTTSPTTDPSNEDPPNNNGSNNCDNSPTMLMIPHDELLEAIQKAPQLVVNETPIHRYVLQVRNSYVHAMRKKNESMKNNADNDSNSGTTPNDNSGSMTSSTSTSTSIAINEDEMQKAAVVEAATKLANHWKRRKELFGERAFLPMAQTTTIISTPTPPTEDVAGDDGSILPNGGNMAKKRRRKGRQQQQKQQQQAKGGKQQHVEDDVERLSLVNGALSEQDMEVLNSGFMVLLPDTTDTRKKRPVVAFDRSKLGSTYNDHSPHIEASKLRVCFYLLQVISSTNPVSQIHGVLAVSLLTSSPSSQWTVGAPTMARTAFPIQDVEFHGVFLPSRIRTLGSLIFSIGKYIIDVFYRVGWGPQTRIHFGVNDESAMSKLMQYGSFNPKDFPVWFGGAGTWDMNRFREWLSEQRKLESKRCISDEAREKQRKAVNARRSQVKRDRANQKFVDLQNQVEHLQHENSQRKKESERLEQLLQYAQTEVNVMEGLQLHAPCGDGSGEGDSDNLWNSSEPMTMYDDVLIEPIPARGGVGAFVEAPLPALHSVTPLDYPCNDYSATQQRQQLKQQAGDDGICFMDERSMNSLLPESSHQELLYEDVLSSGFAFNIHTSDNNNNTVQYNT